MSDSLINDCWNKIGIWGIELPRCHELDKLIHCYNCPVYFAAGRKLLDRELDEKYIDEWTQNLSQPRKSIYQDSKSALVFRLGNEWFALPSSIIQEITQCDKHHSLPHRKNKILSGLVNVRGVLLLCVSLGHLFNLLKKPKSNDDRSTVHERYIIISDQGNDYAFPVSEVKDTLKYDVNNLQQTPSTINKGSSSYIKGIIKHQNIHIGLLDPDLIFSALNRNI
jgi:chemotaxis-related protein WspD